MKKIYIFILTIFIINLLFLARITTFAKSGHNEYQEITLNNKQKKLLINLTNEEKKKLQKQVKWNFFGWGYYLLNENEEATFVGKTIFSRSNLTKEAIVFNYSATSVTTSETTVSTDGSLGISASAKGKILSGGLDAKIRKVVGNTNSTKYTEDTSFKCTIRPLYKVTLLSKGTALVSTGAAKYFILGIPFNKGSFEIIDCVSEYYELREEKLR